MLHFPSIWQDRVRTALDDVRPGLGRGRVRLLGTGDDSVAVLLDEAMVLRFPKHDRAAASMRREAALLPELAERLSLYVPRFALMAPNPLGPGEFCGYPIVPGESLQEDEWHARGLLGQPDVVTTIAATLDELHGFPIERARALGVLDWDVRDDFAEDLANVRNVVVPLLSSKEGSDLLAAWEAYVQDDRNFANEPVLVHADFSLDHLLITDGRITGLIDFGDMVIGDPDYDLSWLWAEAGPEFVRRVQAERGQQLSDRQATKLEFWALADLANDLIRAAHADDRDLTGEALTELRQRLAGQA